MIRPGWVPRDRAHAEELAASAHGKDSYLSPGDAGRGFAAAVEAEGLPRYTVVHVCSRPGRDDPLRPSPGEDAARLRAARSLARGPRPGCARRRRPMTEMSAGRAVVELLKAEGVRHVFGIVGATFLDVLDVLYDDKSVEYVNVRHEQGGAFMADGLARVTGAPAVCLVTSGPGRDEPRDRHRRRPRGALARGGHRRRLRARAAGAGRVPGARPGQPLPSGDEAVHAGDAAEPDPRHAPPRVSHGDDGAQGSRVRRHPAGRAERPGRRGSTPSPPRPTGRPIPRRPTRRRSARRCASWRGRSDRSSSRAAA